MQIAENQRARNTTIQTICSVLCYPNLSLDIGYICCFFFLASWYVVTGGAIYWSNAIYFSLFDLFGRRLVRIAFV